MLTEKNARPITLWFIIVVNRMAIRFNPDTHCKANNVMPRLKVH
nr:MAG TPA_asm: hypothetical protein [Caudoviricetes sp.]